MIPEDQVPFGKEFYKKPNIPRSPLGTKELVSKIVTICNNLV